jgi:hypothetical protein
MSFDEMCPGWGLESFADLLDTVDWTCIMRSSGWSWMEGFMKHRLMSRIGY